MIRLSRELQPHELGKRPLAGLQLIGAAFAKRHLVTHLAAASPTNRKPSAARTSMLPLDQASSANQESMNKVNRTAGGKSSTIETPSGRKVDSFEGWLNGSRLLDDRDLQRFGIIVRANRAGTLALIRATFIAGGQKTHRTAPANSMTPGTTPVLVRLLIGPWITGNMWPDPMSHATGCFRLMAGLGYGANQMRPYGYQLSTRHRAVPWLQAYSHLGEPGFDSRPGTLTDILMRESCRTIPLFGGVFSGITRFPRPCIPALLHTRIASPTSALKTSVLRAAEISPPHLSVANRSSEHSVVVMESEPMRVEQGDNEKVEMEGEGGDPRENPARYPHAKIRGEGQPHKDSNPVRPDARASSYAAKIFCRKKSRERNAIIENVLFNYHYYGRKFSRLLRQLSLFTGDRCGVVVKAIVSVSDGIEPGFSYVGDSVLLSKSLRRNHCNCSVCNLQDYSQVLTIMMFEHLRQAYGNVSSTLCLAGFSKVLSLPRTAYIYVRSSGDRHNCPLQERGVDSQVRDHARARPRRGGGNLAELRNPCAARPARWPCVENCAWLLRRTSLLGKRDIRYVPCTDSSPTGILSAAPRFAAPAGTDQGPGFPQIHPRDHTPSGPDTANWPFGRSAERLDCSPPTNANQVQSPAGSLRFFASENRAGRCRWSGGFLGDLPCHPSLHSDAAPYSPQSPSSSCQEFAVKSRPNLFTRSYSRHGNECVFGRESDRLAAMKRLQGDQYRRCNFVSNKIIEITVSFSLVHECDASARDLELPPRMQWVL
ncbi:hypothetical protein PR048_009419 [Dryococelus australis]|uniref:Uncharacterized protein n=1 Tax=Dryococelus australis TaxID=614101 RepID=A0ABQ9I0R9_9NEOP|nr:hypothetical protein PR048_009419 [Dryococelus australis]